MQPLESWGRYPKARQAAVSVHWRTDPLPRVHGTLLPFGQGRSYGDCCLNEGGTLLATSRLDRLIEFDPGRGVLRCEAGARLGDILAFITNLEHAGDIVEKGLIAAASKRLKRGLSFSVEGQAEIRTMLERLAGNVQAAAAVFMTQDARAARGLLREKEVFRDMEARATEAHFARIRAGRVESVETSALHLDVLRDMKRINAHLAAAAYPVLENLGELLPSRHRSEAAVNP